MMTGVNRDHPGSSPSAISCVIPHAAADALDLATVVARARVADLGQPELATAPAADGTGRVRITCSVRMAYFLIDELRRVAVERMATTDRHALAALGLGVAALYAAIDDAHRAWIGRQSG